MPRSTHIFIHQLWFGQDFYFLLHITALTNRLRVHDSIMVFIHQLAKPWFG
jgi:hypothetical protein